MVGSHLVAVASHSSSIPRRYSQSAANNGASKEEHRVEKGYEGDDIDEAETARIQRLGRERPRIFKSLWAEIGFCYSILASMFMAVSNLFSG